MSPMLQECDRAPLRFSLRSRGSAPDFSMRSRALAAHNEKPLWLLPVFHSLKIETPLGQALQRIRGVLYGFLTIFCYLPEKTRILKHDPYSYATSRSGGSDCLQS